CGGAVRVPDGTGPKPNGTPPAEAKEPRPAAKTPPGHEFLASPQAADELGRLGSYRILKVLGAGGMGIVYQAEDPDLKRLVALKVMRPGVGDNLPMRRRFLREGQAMAALSHEHVVTVYAVGEQRGTPFLAMQFLKGEALE